MLITKLSEQLVEVPGDPGAYFKVTVTVRSDHATAVIPGLGKCELYKDTYLDTDTHSHRETMAWKIEE